MIVQVRLPPTIDFVHYTAAALLADLFLATEQLGGAEQGGVRAHDDKSRDRGQVGAEAALVLETRAERRLSKRLSKLRHDAARDIDAALRSDRQREVSGDRAEHGAEHRDRFRRVLI